MTKAKGNKAPAPTPDENEEASTDLDLDGLDENSRCFLYHSDCPAGKIFQGVDAIADAAADGWSDAPPTE